MITKNQKTGYLEKMQNGRFCIGSNSESYARCNAASYATEVEAMKAAKKRKLEITVKYGFNAEVAS